MKKKKLRTRAEAKQWLKENCTTAASWAKANGFPVRVVQELLRDRTKGNYGVAHDIAVALGIKEGEPTDERRTA